MPCQKGLSFEVVYISQYGLQESILKLLYSRCLWLLPTFLELINLYFTVVPGVSCRWRWGFLGQLKSSSMKRDHTGEAGSTTATAGCTCWQPGVAVTVAKFLTETFCSTDRMPQLFRVMDLQLLKSLYDCVSQSLCAAQVARPFSSSLRHCRLPLLSSLSFLQKTIRQCVSHKNYCRKFTPRIPSKILLSCFLSNSRANCQHRLNSKVGILLLLLLFSWFSRPCCKLDAVVTIYTHTGQVGPCSWVLACAFMPLSVTARCFFLRIDWMEILSSPLLGVLSLPAFLPPTQQTCVTLSSHPSACCRDHPANRPELACAAGIWLSGSSHLLLEEQQPGSPPVCLLDLGQLFIVKLLLLLDFAAIFIPLGDLPSTR